MRDQAIPKAGGSSQEQGTGRHAAGEGRRAGRVNRFRFPLQRAWCIAALLSLGLVPTAPAVVLTATQDAGLREGYPNNNYGCPPAPTLTYVGFLGPYRNRGLIRFDLSQIPGGTQIHSAVMRVWSPGMAGASVTLHAFLTSDPWDECTVTWNTQPSHWVGHQADATWTGVGFQCFDVTDLVVAQWTNPGQYPNYGIKLFAEDTAERNVQISQREIDDPDPRPRLYINECPPLDAPVGLAPCSVQFPEGTTSVTVAWSPVHCATSYLVELFQRNDCADTRWQWVQTGQTSYVFSGLSAGDYSWHVEAFNEDCNPTGSSPFSSCCPFSIEPGGVADLVIDAIETDPAEPWTGDDVKTRALVRNQGNTPAGASQTSFWLDGNHRCDLSTPALGGGQQAWTDWCDFGVASSGRHLAEVCADALGQITESDEGNNCDSVGVFVTGPSYSALEEYSGAQGGTSDVWFYEYRNAGVYSRLDYVASPCWTGSDPWQVADGLGWIGPEYQDTRCLPAIVKPNNGAWLAGHPGRLGGLPGYDTVLRWRAPQAGTSVRVHATFRGVGPNGGDGLDVSLLHGSQVLDTFTITSDDTLPHVFDRVVSLGVNDSLALVVSARTTNFYDLFGMNMAVAYLDQTSGADPRTPVPASVSGMGDLIERVSPNPFRSSVEILLREPLRSSAQTRLEVYDVAGRLVRILGNADFGADGRSIRWDGRDARGLMVDQGLYLVRLRVGERTCARKLILSR